VNQPKPRRPASSRTTTSRPRKIAGRPDAAEVTTPADADERPSKARAKVASGPKQPAPRKEPKTPKAARQPGSTLSMFAGAGLTRVLLVGLAVLVLVLVGELVWRVTDSGFDRPKPPPAGEIAVPDHRPIILNQTDVDAGLDQAAKDATVILTRSYKDYDDDVAKSVDLMTDRFASKFKETAADSKSGYLEKKVDVEAKVLYQGAVRANRTQLQALLFLNQWITKGTGKDRRITLTPYRVLVTMIHTDTGWLVDNLDTK